MAVTAIRGELRIHGWIRGTEKPDLAAAVRTGRLAGVAAGQLGSVAFRVILLRRSAEPGQVLVAHSTHALLQGEIPREFGLHDLGERELPGMTPGHVYESIRPSVSG